MPDFNTVVTAVLAILMSLGFLARVSKGLESIPGWHERSELFKYLFSTLLFAAVSILIYLLTSSPEVRALPANNPGIAALFTAIGWAFVQWYHEQTKDAAPEPGLVGS